MKSNPSSNGPRERLLDAANKLFYEEGIHTVGIDRVIERAGVAKASLYSAFGSKEALIRAYLTRQKALQQERVESRLTRHTAPRARILAIFDGLGDTCASPTFRGCPFIRASAEGAPDAAAKQVSADARAWLRTTFVDLARDAAVKKPERLAQQLVLLYDGALVSAQIDGDASAAKAARDAAAAMIDAASPRRATRLLRRS